MFKVCPVSRFHTKQGRAQKIVGRNASWERFRTNFIHILAYLSQGQDGFPNEMCLFGEVAAFQVLAVQTGHWQAWHENLVLQVLSTSKQSFFCSNLFELKDFCRNVPYQKQPPTIHHHYKRRCFLLSDGPMCKERDVIWS